MQTHRPSATALMVALIAALTAGTASARAGGHPEGRYRSYDYAETAAGVLKEVRLTIPDGLAVVRGILVVSNPAGGDTRGSYAELWCSEFMHLHGFAFVGTKGFDSHTPSVRVLEHALKQFAGQCGHSELVNAPFVATGFSAGGGFSSRLLVELPERVVAVAIICSRLNFTGLTPSAANMATPALIVTGENENLGRVVEPVLAAYRPRGALYSWMTVQGGGHARSGQEVLAMPFLDAAVRLRYPADADVRKAPVRLKPLDRGAGWLADNTTWRSALTHIAPAKDFRGDLTRSSWLPTEDIAFIYRAYATYDSPLTITSPVSGPGQDRAVDAGAGIKVAVDASRFPGWRKLELYDGARKVGTVTAGPAEFTAQGLAPGFHALSVLGTDAAGAVRTSRPVLVVVRQVARTPQ